MKIDSMREIIKEFNPEALLFDNPSFDKSIIGISDEHRVVYDYDRMVHELATDDNISIDDAVDFIDYNIIESLTYMPVLSRPIVLYHEDAEFYYEVNNELSK